MITLLTGLPRNGKTLFLMTHVKKRSEVEGREVFYAGIPGVKLPWTEFDSKKWMDLSDGAIIVIDEAQDTFPKKPNGSVLPDYYEMLAKHGHKGFDIYLLTQHPSFLDNFPRKLVNQHFHVVRKFGMQRSTIYEWDKVAEFPERIASQKNSVGVIKFKYPKEAFGWYTSASQHTVKARVPLKLILAGLMVLVVSAYVIWVFTHMARGKELTPVPAPVAASLIGGSSAAGHGASVPFDPVADARNFVLMSRPRIAGLPQTAPKYDELTKPVRVPVPAACIQRGDIHRGEVNCKCLTQQGTPMDVPLNMCVEFARNGFFQDFDADKERAASLKAVQSGAVLDSSSAGKALQASGGSQVTMFASDLVASVTPPPSAVDASPVVPRVKK